MKRTISWPLATAIIALVLLLALVAWWLVPRIETPDARPPTQDRVATSTPVEADRPPLPEAAPTHALADETAGKPEQPAREPVLGGGGGGGSRLPRGIRVIDVLGAAVPGATVALWTRDGEHPFAPELSEGRDGYFGRHRHGEVIDPADETWALMTWCDPAWGEPESATTTDQAGRCWMDIPRGRVLLSATVADTLSSGEWIGDVWEAIESAEAEGDSPPDLVLVVRPTCGLTGQALDAAGRPAVGAIVYSNSGRLRPQVQGIGRPRPVTTDGEGHFELRVAPGFYVFVAQLGSEWSTTEAVLFQEQGEGPIVLRFGTPFSIAGTVLDPAGRPIAGAKVRASASNGMGEGTVSNGEGRFRLPLPQPGSWLVGAMSEALLPADVVELEVVEGAAAQATLHLVEPGKILGRVSWSTGAPASGFEVEAFTGFARQEPRIDKVAGLGSFPQTAISDTEGAFEVEGLHPSLAYRVSASKEAEGAEAKALDDVQPGAFIEMTVDADTSGFGSIVGSVSDVGTGAPIPEFLVSLTTTPDHEERYGRIADWRHVQSADGTFRCDGQHRREVFVQVQAPGYCLATAGPVTPTAEGAPVALELGRVAQLVVRIADQDGLPALGATVLLMQQPREKYSMLSVSARSATTDSAGQFTWSELVPGTYLAQALDSGRCSGVSRIEVPSGSRTEAVIALEAPGRTGTVLVTVRDTTGAPQPGISVRLAPLTSDADTPSGYHVLSHDTLTDDLGVARFPSVPQGVYMAQGMVDGRPTFSNSILVQPNETAEIQMRRGGD